MSRATSHAAAAGLRLSWERRARPGHVPAPDPHSCQGSFRPETLLWPGPYSERPEPVGMPSWKFRTASEGSGCAYRGPVFLCGGPDLMMHPGVHYLSLPRGAPRPAHVVGSGTVLRVARRCCTCTASLTLICVSLVPTVCDVTLLTPPGTWPPAWDAGLMCRGWIPACMKELSTTLGR
jgi:hypothetical protein